MKIISKDNYGMERDDILVCENINKYYGQLIVDYLNSKLSGDYSPSFFRLVEDDYQLFKFQP